MIEVINCWSIVIDIQKSNDRFHFHFRFPLSKLYDETLWEWEHFVTDQFSDSLLSWPLFSRGERFSDHFLKWSVSRCWAVTSAYHSTDLIVVEAKFWLHHKVAPSHITTAISISRLEDFIRSLIIHSPKSLCPEIFPKYCSVSLLTWISINIEIKQEQTIDKNRSKFSWKIKCLYFHCMFFSFIAILQFPYLKKIYFSALAKEKKPEHNSKKLKFTRKKYVGTKLIFKFNILQRMQGL